MDAVLLSRNEGWRDGSEKEEGEIKNRGILEWMEGDREERDREEREEGGVSKESG